MSNKQRPVSTRQTERGLSVRRRIGVARGHAWHSVLQNECLTYGVMGAVSVQTDFMRGGCFRGDTG